jgi:hypothetical protein
MPLSPPQVDVSLKKSIYGPMSVFGFVLPHCLVETKYEKVTLSVSNFSRGIHFSPAPGGIG